MQIFKKRSNLGLKTLFDICKIESHPTTFDLGFKLGPRINAGGRVGKSSHGANLLLNNNPKTYIQRSGHTSQGAKYLSVDENESGYPQLKKEHKCYHMLNLTNI